MAGWVLKKRNRDGIGADYDRLGENGLLYCYKRNGSSTQWCKWDGSNWVSTTQPSNVRVGYSSYNNSALNPIPTAAAPGSYNYEYISITAGTYRGTWAYETHEYDTASDWGYESNLYYWDVPTYNITVNVSPSGSGTATGSGNFLSGTRVVINATANPGFTFSKWSDGVTSQSRTITVSGTKTYTANISPNKYTVTFDKQYGTGGTNSVTATYTQAMPSATMPTRTGYQFNGYFDATINGNQYYGSGGGSVSEWDKRSNATLYAHWTAKGYTVTFDKQKGTGGSDSVKATYASAMPPATMPTRSGYQFNGYFDSTSGGTKYYNANGTSARAWNKDSNTTLYAQWTPYKITLEYAVNGGVINNSPYQYNTNTWFKIISGYVCQSTTSNGTYNRVQTVINTGTSYANLWDVATFRVVKTGYEVVDSNAYLCGTVPVHQNDSETNTVNKVTVSRLNNGQALTQDITKTLTMNWQPSKYTVTFVKQGGNNGSNSVTATYNQSMPSAIMPTRTGYTFQGYYDATSGGTQYYTAAGVSARTWNKTANTELYAQWTPKDITVRYSSDLEVGSIELPISFSEKYNTDIYASALSNPTGVPNGYEFYGWSSSKQDAHEGKIYKPTDKIHTADAGGEDDIFVYACWKIKVTFHANGSGDDFPSDVITDKIESCFFTESISAPGPSDFVPYGYRYWTFNDWTTTAGGTGEAYDPNEVVKPANSYGAVYDLYAHTWEKGNTIYAMFNPTSGSLSFEFREGGIADGTDDGYGEVYYRGTNGVEDTRDRVPWASVMSQIKSVRFETDVTPITTANWFNGATQLTEFSTTTTILNGNGQEETKGLKGNALTSMSAMFQESGVQTVIFDDSFVFSELGSTSMNNMFNGCNSLTSVNFGARFAPSSALESMTNLFKGCQSLTTITNLRTTGITSFSNLFNGCSQLPNDILTSIDISSAENLVSCYEGCTQLASFSLTIPANEISVGRMFYGCTELSGNIKVKNTFIDSVNHIFAGTKNDIYIVNTDSADTATWRAIALEYLNVHFEADDNPPPTIGKVSTYERGELSGNTFDNTEESGTAIKFTVGSCDVVSRGKGGAKLPENFTEGEGVDAVTYNWDNNTYSIRVLMDGQEKYSKSGVINTEEVVQFDTGDTKRHVLQLVITDAVGKSATRLITVASPTATIDFKAGGEGVAIGTFASQNGFNVQMPTMIGKGLKFYSQCVIRRIKLFQCNEYKTHQDDETLSDLKYIPYAMKDNDLVTIAYTWYDGIDASSTPLEFTKDTVTKINGETRCYLNPPGLSASTPTVLLNGETVTMAAPTTVPTSEAVNYLNQVFYEMMRDTWVDISEPQLVVGRYNIPVEDALLVIGNGTSSNPSNSLVIYQDGTYDMPGRIMSEDLVVDNLLVKGHARVVNGTLLGGVYSTATATLPASSWSDNTQTVEVIGVTPTNIVMVTPAPNSAATWSSGGVICSGQGQDTLTFSCEVRPTSDIDVNVIIL